MSSKGEAKDFINLGIIVNNKDEVLMIRRKDKETGKAGAVLEWAFPGGKQRYAESRKDCVEREVLDETGYSIEWIQEISMRLHPEVMVFIAKTLIMHRYANHLLGFKYF